MDDYAGRVLADRYRLPLPPSDEYELVETRAFDTYSGQEVLVRQLPLPEVVDAEVMEPDGPAGYAGADGARVPSRGSTTGRAVRRSGDPAVRRAIEAAQAAAQIPDHPRLDQVFDVFAEAGSLWIVSELVAARPLAALLAEKPLSPYRAAEIGSDVLTALRALHAHGWVHRNITVRTVLVCDDGRVVLTGLAAGAAEEALCGYAPVPDPDADDDFPHPPDPPGPAPTPLPALAPGYEPATPALPEPRTLQEPPPALGHSALTGTGRGGAPGLPAPERPGLPEPAAPDHRASRAGAIAAYRAGARAAGRADEAGAALSLPPPPKGPAAPAGGTPGDYEPQWWTHAADLDDDEDDDHDPGHPGRGRATGPGDGSDEGGTSGGGAPRRALLTGTWSDGPGSGSGIGSGAGPVPAGGGVSPYGARDALRADARRQGQPRSGDGTVPPPGTHAGAHSGAPGASGEAAEPRYRGPATPLAAERARQARVAIVGAVTERWAPEQAGPVHDTWQLAPPIGPSTDLWALGALLYRAVQGHAPYPEENAAELVQMVCAEPPAFAEECGPLRPVVESLLRQDPTERPDFEELRGWLRSLVRSAPEPDAGAGVVPMPSVDAARLPVVRRRGELVRRRRAGAAGTTHGRHRGHARRARPAKSGGRVPGNAVAPHGARGPRALGRTLLIVILLALVAAIAYAVMFMPKAEQQQGQARTPQAPQTPPASQQPQQPQLPSQNQPSGDPQQQQPTPSVPAPSTNTVSPGSPNGPDAPDMPAGYTLRDDPEGFRIGVDKTWHRSPINDVGQIRYTGGDFTLIVVPGRDTVAAGGSDPLEYQRTKERELQPWRDSSWATASGLRRIDVGRQVMAEGQFTWSDANGREVYVRNLALIVGDRYHVVQVLGPESQRDKVSEIYQQAVSTYRSTR
ncbi:protein kinase [Streptomyces ficellus]|uniref:Serine/threonine protein kinase n=1 Tax=Streptomyces ficellus TaxID=1977088 RepID=A0A6I6F4R0_9ACTN|nr:protein kinase [Streptomyces ficellus]QGV79003.1 serine/threonine protein kinase [Streptomyces ficellus]